MSEGFCYIVYGDQAKVAADHSLMTLRQHNTRPIHVIGNRELKDSTLFEFIGWGAPGRWAKTNLDRLSPFSRTCYLDADTIIHSDLSIGFAILRDGWDIVIAPSVNQNERWLDHIESAEKLETLTALGEKFLQLQAGVIWFDTGRCKKLFQYWRAEWNRFRDQDQAALLRALYKSPVKVWLLGHPWSNGENIRHLHGQIK